MSEMLMFAACLCTALPGVEKITDISTSDIRFNKGVSACFSGILDETFLVAGGCNFPDVCVSQGGEKVFYQEIYAAKMPLTAKSHWEKVGMLPEPCAYGACVKYRDALILFGGLNQGGALNGIWIISKKNGKFQVTQAGCLPFTLDNVSVVLLENTIYFAGGNVNGSPVNRLYALDAASLPWNSTDTVMLQSLPEFPGFPRTQPVLCGLGTYLYLSGGAFSGDETRKPYVYTDLLRYDVKNRKWDTLTAPCENGKKVTFTGGAGLALDDGRIFFLGGVHAQIFQEALVRLHEMKWNKKLSEEKRQDFMRQNKDYFLHPPIYYQFNPSLFFYDIKKEKWYVLGQSSYLALAGAALVQDKNAVYMIQGEVKPGIRTPAIIKVVIPE